VISEPNNGKYCSMNFLVGTLLISSSF
jgi:hypothetical protein